MCTSTDQFKAELDANLEDYRAKISEIVVQIGNQDKALTTIITSIGFVLAASPFIIEFQVPIVLGVASFVFYALALTQIRYAWTVAALENYLANNTVPNIRRLLTGMAPGEIRSFDRLMMWHSSVNATAYTQTVWFLPIEAARYAIPVFAGIVCCVGYWFIASSWRNPGLDIVITVLNLVAAIYVVVVGYETRRRLVEHKV